MPVVDCISNGWPVHCLSGEEDIGLILLEVQAAAAFLSETIGCGAVLAAPAHLDVLDVGSGAQVQNEGSHRES
jgi:hypothetical protein